MSGYRNRIGRKDFISGCGKAVLGLGLGLSCGKPVDRDAPAAQSSGNGVSRMDEAPITPAYRSLGKAGIKVTEIGFGASRTMDPQLIDYALRSGINMLDTGRSYNNGQNEVLVGRVIKGRRHEVVINGKTQPGSLEKMLSDLEASLSALGTDYIDCLLVHGIGKPEEVGNEVHKEFIARAKESGKARVTGFSCHGDLPAMLNAAADDGSYEVVMVPYNFMGGYTHMLGGSTARWDAPALDTAITRCGKAGIDIIAMKSCSGGFQEDGDGPRTYRAALKWVLRNPYVKTTATAMGNFQQIEEDARAMGAGSLSLKEEALLERYAQRFGSRFCRMCGSCAGQCPEGVNVAEVNRFHMYAAGYGGTMAAEGRERYARLGRASAAACAGCASCSVKCPYGLPLASKLNRAHAMLA